MKAVDAPEFRALLTWWRENRWASIGFAGTHMPLTLDQRRSILSIFRAALSTVPLVQFHHCDRAGAEAEAHEIAMDVGLHVVTHPHSKALYSAGTVGHENRPAWPSLRATEDMVNESHLILTAPRIPGDVINWAAVSFAKAKRKAHICIAPDPTIILR